MQQVEKLALIIKTFSAEIGEMQQELFGNSNYSSLTIRQLVYLEVIMNVNNPTPTELAELLGLKKASISAMVKNMVEAGLVEKKGSIADGRSYHLCLTPRGRQINRLHEDAHRRLALKVLNGLDPEERVQLIELLEKSLLIE